MDIIVPNGNEMHSVMYGWVYWSAWYQDIPLYARVIESILLLNKEQLPQKKWHQKIWYVYPEMYLMEGRK